MKTIIVYRFWQDTNQTLGNCTILNDDLRPLFSSLSLERGWRDNERNVSCVPLGEYKLKLEYSNKFQRDLWELKGVPNRSECKFHSANYWYQLNGCIALGRDSIDINRDGYSDITSSTSTMNAFHKAMGSDTEAILIIKD
jgi:hypothetical protein